MKARPDDISWREVDGEVILLDERNWNYLHLNGSAAVLWALIAGGASESDLVDRLVGDYSISRDRAEADVTQFVTDLTARELLVA